MAVQRNIDEAISQRIHSLLLPSGNLHFNSAPLRIVAASNLVISAKQATLWSSEESFQMLSNDLYQLQTTPTPFHVDAVDNDAHIWNVPARERRHEHGDGLRPGVLHGGEARLH